MTIKTEHVLRLAYILKIFLHYQQKAARDDAK